MFFSRILNGVPKFRKSKEKILTRRFSPLRMLTVSPISDCPECHNLHSPWVCCLQCYQLIKDESDQMKKRLAEGNSC